MLELEEKIVAYACDPIRRSGWHFNTFGTIVYIFMQHLCGFVTHQSRLINWCIFTSAMRISWCVSTGNIRAVMLPALCSDVKRKSIFLTFAFLVFSAVHWLLCRNLKAKRECQRNWSAKAATFQPGFLTLIWIHSNMKKCKY